MTDRRKKPSRWEDKTPSEPLRLKSATALNLLELASEATLLACRYDRAEREDDGVTRELLGEKLIKLGGDFSQAGWGVKRDEKKGRKRG